MQKLQLVYNMYICFRLCREHTFQLLFQIIYKLEILRKLEMFPICPLITSYMSAKSYSSSKSKVSSKSILLPKVHVCQKCFLMVLPKLTSKSVYNRSIINQKIWNLLIESYSKVILLFDWSEALCNHFSWPNERTAPVMTSSKTISA